MTKVLKKTGGAFKWVWKNARVWLIVAASVQLLFFVATMVVMFASVAVDGNRVSIQGTVNIVLGGPRTVHRSGDPAPFFRYTIMDESIVGDTPEARRDRHGFRQFSPRENIVSKQIAHDEAHRLNEEIVSEGIVLLTNANRAGNPVLPIVTSPDRAIAQRPGISVFGKNSANIVVGGSGSSDGGDGGGEILIEGFERAGFRVNPVLRAFYNNDNLSGGGRPQNPDMGSYPPGFPTGETPWDYLRDTEINSFSSYSNAAVIVISRISGEGFDLPRSMRVSWGSDQPITGAYSADDHYLRLDRNERELVRQVTTLRNQGVFDSVIMLFNLSTSMELGFLDTHEFGHVDAALWIGSPGENLERRIGQPGYEGAHAVGRVLSGAVNPSGRLFGTFARNFFRNPALQNFANMNVAIGADGSTPIHASGFYNHLYLDMAGGNSLFRFVEYQEGIYVGYRYYETRAFHEATAPTPNPNWHRDNVVFPFGYGLSYTDFNWSVVEVRQNGVAIDSAQPAFPFAHPTINPDGTVNDTAFEFDVRVTNTGNFAGKDVVQIYTQSPYTAPTGAYSTLEVPLVALSGFAKTSVLAPNASQVVTISINAFDFASYDYRGLVRHQGHSIAPNGGWVLPSGNGHFFVARDAHSAWNNVAGRESHWVPFNIAAPFAYPVDPHTGNEVRNRFSDPVAMTLDGEVDYANLTQYAISGFMPARGRNFMSRSNFLATFPTNPSLPEGGNQQHRRVPDVFLNTLRDNSVQFTQHINDAPDDPISGAWYVPASQMPTQGVRVANGARLYHLVRPQNNQPAAAGGRSFLNSALSTTPAVRNSFNHLRDEVGSVRVVHCRIEEPLWDQILDQLSISEMAEIIENGAFSTVQMAHIGKPRTTDPDGPSGFVSFMNDPSVHGTAFYASGPTIAATWNTDLAFDFGVMIGIEGLLGDRGRWAGDNRPYSGWYAPGMNIHRTPFSGRNSEYYSECPFLSGMIGAHTILGARSKGITTFVKHFAINDQETDRSNFGLVTWFNEQTAREIYLRPFEMAVKVGGTTAKMSAFNRIGTVWAGGSYRLLTELLREEWGFRGAIITDFNMYTFMNIDQMIRAGGDLNLLQGGNQISRTGEHYTATTIMRMRDAVHNILYVTVRSNAMNGWGDGVVWGEALPMWQIFVILFNVLLFVGLFLVWGFLKIFFTLRKQRALAKSGASDTDAGTVEAYDNAAALEEENNESAAISNDE